jgi:class 3 adenylate cyclase/tetratricopeptide (TPR) repeat protein
MICRNCGTENRPGRKFCSSCAAPLPLECPVCGSPNEPTDRYCGECASPLPGGGAAAVGAAAVGPGSDGRPAATSGLPAAAERRLVSVLFADLVGFTAFAEERDPEAVRQSLTRYFDIASDVIERHGGTVEKFIGDAVMAVWGTPVAQEDDPERSVRAALDLVDAVRAVGPNVQARVAVMTGEAAATLGARNQGLVVGDLVNTASRLQAVAEPGTVLVGEATRRAAATAIAFEPAGEQTLKGRVAPVPAFRALRVIAERGGRGRSESLEPPFVGRDDELRHLKDFFHATVRDGRLRLVSVSGTAGIGKGRLAWEFEKYLDGIVEAVLWHRGRCPAYGAGVTFWPLGEMIRERAGLAEGDDETITRVKVAATLDDLDLSETERRWIEPALLALLGLDAGIGAEQLFGAWRTFFERLAARAPVVLLFEDLQWADSGTLAFIDHLVEWSRSSRLFILALARPELDDRHPEWAAAHRNRTRIALEPLTDDDIRALLVGLAPGLPPATISAIVARADGVPLYAVETVRMLLAQGRLEPDAAGAASSTGPSEPMAIPETLTALIAARLDALEPADRSLVLDAAVLGLSFSTAALAAVSRMSDDDLEPRLRSLVRRELFAHQTDPRSPERGQYAFVQGLIREVAYNVLSHHDRKVRHLAAARYFASLDSDEIAAALAEHWFAARANAADGPERDALTTQARLALQGAAERATTLGAHAQALEFERQALSVTSDPDERGPVLEAAGESALSAGRYVDAEAFLVEALALRRARQDRLGSARITALLGRTLLTARQNDRATGLLRTAVDEFADLGSNSVTLELQGQLGRALMLREEDDAALATIEPVLAAAEQGDLRPLLAESLVTKGTTLISRSRFVEGFAVIDAGEHLARSEGLIWTALRAVNNHLSALIVDPVGGAQIGREGLALARRIGDRTWVFAIVAKLCQGYWILGQWDEAVDLLESAIADAPEPADRAELVQLLVRIRAARGEPVEAMLAESQHLTAQITDPQITWTAPDALAFAQFAAGRFSDSAATYHNAVRAFRGKSHEWLHGAAVDAFLLGDAQMAAGDLRELDALGYRVPTVDGRRAMIRGGLAALAGDETAALEAFGKARATFQDIGMALDEGLLGIVMASVMDPGTDDLASAVARAQTVLGGLRATALLALLDEASARRDRAADSRSPAITASSRAG